MSMRGRYTGERVTGSAVLFVGAVNADEEGQRQRAVETAVKTSSQSQHVLSVTTSPHRYCHVH